MNFSNRVALFLGTSTMALALVAFAGPGIASASVGFFHYHGPHQFHFNVFHNTNHHEHSGDDLCSDGIDNDNDGLIDALDPDCGGTPPPTATTGTLNVVVIVNNTNGTGSAVASDFDVNVTEAIGAGATTTVPGSPVEGSAGTAVSIDGGATYDATEVVQDGYDVNYSADCQGSLAAGESKTCTITNTDTPPPAACTTGVGSPLLVDVTQQISNDPDSSVPGPNWALDNFNRHIRIWQEGTHYCGQADDTGTFTTFGGETGISPQSGAPMPSVFTGTMVGSTHGELTGTFGDAGSWGTTGTVPAQDCNSLSCSMTSLWVTNYFGAGANYAYSPSPADSTGDWSWTYTACGHGSWTNQNAGNVGDLIEGPTDEDCTPAPTDPSPSISNNPQCSDGIDNDNDGRVDYPADGSCSDASDNSEGNDGGAFFGTFGGNTGGNGNAPGGLVLGASTDVPACSNPLITSFMKMGGKNDSDQVKKLQDFLNTNISAGLTVNGIFDSATMQAVKAFQLKYWQDVLAPWKPWGLGDHDATGYVYKTTQRMINLLSCSNLILPLPQLP